LDDPTWLYAIVFDDGRRDPAQTLDDAIRRAAMAAVSGRTAVFIERGSAVILGGAELTDAIAQRTVGGIAL
jgi:hypothetical protein